MRDRSREILIAIAGLVGGSLLWRAFEAWMRSQLGG